MANLKNKPVNMRFNQQELEKIELAKKYTTINSTPMLIRSCVNMAMRDVCESDQIHMTFLLEKKMDKKVVSALGVSFDNECNMKLEKLFKSIPMTPSNIVKYFLMPELDLIIENKGWNR